MFKNTSQEFKAQLLKELIAFENNNIPTKENEESVSTVLAGYVHYRAGDDIGKVELEVGFNDVVSSLVKYKTGKTSIVINHNDFSNKIFSVLEAIIAHELGHYLSGHLDKDDHSYLSLYETESKTAIDIGDQEGHIYWSARCITEGGYIVREMQADMLAARFVGIGKIFHMQMSDAFEHDNLTVAIEKLNRLKYLNDCFKEDVTPANGYEMAIEFIKPGSDQNQNT